MYIYIYYVHTHINLYLSLHFSDDWLLLFDEKISHSVESRLFDVTFSIYYFIYVRPVWEKKKIKLMFFPKNHILFAEEGRPVGPIDWWCAMIEMTMHAMGPPWGQVAPGWLSEVSRVRQREPHGTGVHLPPPIYHHATTRAQWYVVNPGEIPVVGLLCVLRSSSSSSLGREKEKHRERFNRRYQWPTTVCLSIWETNIYANSLYHQYMYHRSSPYCKPTWS